MQLDDQIITLGILQMYERIQSTDARISAKIIKGICIGSGALIIAFAVSGLIMMIVNNLISAKFFLVFSPIFIAFFGGVMIGVELKVGWILQTFDFLGTLLGKGLFYIYLSSSIFFFFVCGPLNETILAWVSSMIIFGLGVLFVILHNCDSGYGNEVKQELN